MKKNRRSIRMKGFDYSTKGHYFVTVCSERREEIFGKIVGAKPQQLRGRHDLFKMELNNNGKMVKEVWEAMPRHFNVELDEFVIMPNHVHAIIRIVDQGASCRAPTLGWLIGMFKTECTKRINKLNGVLGWKRFQRNYFERIIRNEGELLAIREYVRLNPLRWDGDRNNPSRCGTRNDGGK